MKQNESLNIFKIENEVTDRSHEILEAFQAAS